MPKKTTERTRDGAARETAPPGAAPRDAVLPLPRPFRLHYGGELEEPRIAFRVVGPENAPLIAVLGGISAHRIVSDRKSVV